MTKADDAVADFNKGFNCSQSVFAAFAPELGMDREKAFRVATGFGGGMARQGMTCGAVTGALMVLGLRHGIALQRDVEGKERTYARTLHFMQQFRERHGSVLCREILGCDLSTPEGQREARDKGLFQTVCPRAVRDAVEILDGME